MSEGKKLLPVTAPQMRCGDPVLDGLPLGLAEESRQRNGNVGEHKQGEGEHIHDLLDGGGADILPLCNGGDTAQHQQSQVYIQQHLPHGLKSHQQVVSGQSTDDTQREVDEDTDGGEDKAGIMAMDISKQEKLPRKMPRRRRAP